MGRLGQSAGLGFTSFQNDAFGFGLDDAHPVLRVALSKSLTKTHLAKIHASFAEAVAHAKQDLPDSIVERILKGAVAELLERCQ